MKCDLLWTSSMPHLTRALTLVTALLAILAFLPLGPATAGDRELEAAASERGARSFRIHCQSCHGEKGDGHGPMAEWLKIRPADLTKLREADGTFPDERIFQVVDGRQDVRGHGRRDMPVWGLTFQDMGNDSDREAEVRARIFDLVVYLESIQADPDGSERPE